MGYLFLALHVTFSGSAVQMCVLSKVTLGANVTNAT